MGLHDEKDEEQGVSDETWHLKDAMAVLAGTVAFGRRYYGQEFRPNILMIGSMNSASKAWVTRAETAEISFNPLDTPSAKKRLRCL